MRLARRSANPCSSAKDLKLKLSLNLKWINRPRPRWKCDRTSWIVQVTRVCWMTTKTGNFLNELLRWLSSLREKYELEQHTCASPWFPETRHNTEVRSPNSESRNSAGLEWKESWQLYGRSTLSSEGPRFSPHTIQNWARLLTDPELPNLRKDLTLFESWSLALIRAASYGCTANKTSKINSSFVTRLSTRREVGEGKCLWVKVPPGVWAKTAHNSGPKLAQDMHGLTHVDTCSENTWVHGVLFMPQLQAPPPEQS